MSLRILIVEDSAAQAESLALCLRAKGWTVWLAYNGLSASGLAELHELDAVILDWLMPGLGGMAFLDWLRSRPETAQLPVVVTTGLPVEEVADVANRSLTAVLRKPFSVDALVSTIERLIARRAEESHE